MSENLKQLVKSLGEERFKYNENLSSYTFSKLGGPAEVLFVATSIKDLMKILDLAHDLKIDFFVFGAGTKMLISDRGLKNLVIKNRTSGIKIAGVKGKVGRGGLGIEEALVEVESGVSIGKLNEFLTAQNLETISGYSSLHSSIGGSIFLDPILRERVVTIKVWEEGLESQIPINKLKQGNQVVLSVIFKFKSKF